MQKTQNKYIGYQNTTVVLIIGTFHDVQRQRKYIRNVYTDLETVFFYITLSLWTVFCGFFGLCLNLFLN